MKKINTKALVGTAIFAALAFAVTFVFRLPFGFLTFDAKDAVILIGAFLYGPVSGVLMALIAALLELITVSSTRLYGFVMNFASSAVFAGVASLIYSKKRSAAGAVLSLYAASLVLTGTMMLLNLWITPYYMGVTVEDVAHLIPTFLLPFNLAKALCNSALAMFLYKPFSKAAISAHLAEKHTKDPDPCDEKPIRKNRNTLLMLLCGALTLAVAVLIFVFLKK